MILFSMFWQNPAVVGLIIAIPATALGYLGYRRSSRLDEVAKQAGIATTSANSIGQVVDGLNRVITALQSDNLVLRGEVGNLKKGQEQIQARIDAVEVGSVDLRAKNRELEQENIALHKEIEELKVENLALRKRIDELEKNNGPTN